VLLTLLVFLVYHYHDSEKAGTTRKRETMSRAELIELAIEEILDDEGASRNWLKNQICVRQVVFHAWYNRQIDEEPEALYSPIYAAVVEELFSRGIILDTGPTHEFNLR